MVPVPSASLGGIPMFANLPPEQLQRVADRLHQRLVPAGTEIITQEEPGDTVFLVMEGSVKVCRRRPEGGEVILSVLGSGELVGEMSVADGLDRWASVATLEDSRVLWMDGESFRSLLGEIPIVRSRLIELLCRRVRLADDRLETLAAFDVEGRVACVLLSLARQHGEPKPGGGTRIPVPLSQADIAAMTGASRVRVNLILARFRRYGWITLDGRRRMSVQDATALGSRCR
jgi:CRP-like cAMP-binding protein